MKLVLLLLFLTTFTFAEKVTHENIPDSITNAIMLNECFIENKLCNPYVVALNKKSDIKKAKKLGYKIKYRRIIKCKNLDRCVKITKKLIANGIKSLDLGAYQMNYHFNPDNNLKVYFDMQKAELKVKKIIARLINRHGYSWQTLGRYHSGTKSKNESYCKRLFANLN